jgi:hypothetical protein
VTEGDGHIFFKTSSGETSFSSQNALKRLAARLRRDPLRELRRSPRPLAAVPKAVEWILRSGSLAAVRDALLQEAVEKLFKIVIAKDFIFTSKCTKNFGWPYP